VTFKPDDIEIEEFNGVYYFRLAGFDCGILPPVEQNLENLKSLVEYIRERLLQLESDPTTPVNFDKEFPEFAEQYGTDYTFETTTTIHHAYDYVTRIYIQGYGQTHPVADVLFNNGEWEISNKVIGTILLSIHNLIDYLWDILLEEE